MSDVLTDHLYGDAAPARPAAVPAPSHAELSRSLLAAHGLGSLSTLRPDGHPFGSVVQYVVDERGRPVVFVSALAEHTRNLAADARACLLVAAPSAPGDDPMALARVSLVGSCERLTGGADDAEVGALRASFVATHPTVAAYLDFADFAFWRLEPAEVRYVGGYGRMSWVEPSALAAAAVDPLARDAAGIVAHMNDDHADACLLYARALGGVREAVSARLTAVDRLGMELLAVTPAGLQPFRLNFDEPQDHREGVRRAVVALLAGARTAGGDGAVRRA